jgi:error-prone DNA polymerase
VVRAWTAAKDLKKRVGPRPDRLPAGLHGRHAQPALLPVDREAFARLTRLLTVGQRRAEKGECHLFWKDFPGPCRRPAGPDRAAGQGWTRPSRTDLNRMAGELRGRVWLAASRAYAAQDLKRLSRLDELAREAGAPMVATNDVLYHGPERRPCRT